MSKTTTSKTPTMAAVSANGAASESDTPAEPAVPAALGGDTPSPVLDLDELENDESRGPFLFSYHGFTYSMLEPAEIDWQDLITALGNPARFFSVALSEEHRDRFLAEKTPVWKVNQLVKRYLGAYGLPDLGNAAALLG